MTDEDRKQGAHTLLEAWLMTAADSWKAAAESWVVPGEDSGSKASAEGAGDGSWKDTWQGNVKALRALSAVMAEPEVLAEVAKGIQTLPELALKTMKPAWESFLHLQQEWLEKAGRIEKSTVAYHFENLDQEAFKAWSEIYEKEFRQFLHIPQLGLTRFYQERMSEAVDKFNVFQGKMAEFLSLLYLPFEKSSKVMQDQLAKMADGGDLPQKAKEYYGIWIKILEGHFMNLFKSPEYAEELRQTVNALGEFILARQKILEDYLQSLPIPSQRDMDDLYKELYVLKRRIRELEKSKKGVSTEQQS